jgi:hypothetical protein
VSPYDDPIDLSAQDELKAKREVEAQAAKELEASDIRWLMSSKRGRRIVWRLLEEGQPFADPFNPNNAIMARNVGRQGYARALFVTIRTLCPELELVMLKESLNVRDGDGSGKNSN